MGLELNAYSLKPLASRLFLFLYFDFGEKIRAGEHDECCNGSKDTEVCDEAEMGHVDEGSAEPINAVSERVYHGYDDHRFR